MSIRKLRPDQRKAVQFCMSYPECQIVYPTGSGKSVIAQEVVRKMCRRRKLFIGVVFVPRILLSKQWIKTSADYLMQTHNLPFNFVQVNSGGLSQVIKNDIEQCLKDMNMGIIPVLSSTNPLDVQKRVNRLVNDGCHVLIFCTYHSNKVLHKAKLPISLAIYDEAQFLPNSPDFLLSTELEVAKKIFLTATPRYTDSDEGTGMNNEGIYGPVFEAKPKAMIKIGAIVSPKIHVVSMKADMDGVISELNDVIKDRKELLKSGLKQKHPDIIILERKMNKAYNQIADMIFSSHARHRIRIKSDSINLEWIGAKLLVVCNGQLPLQGIFQCKRWKQLMRENPHIKIFGLCTDFGVYYDGSHYKPPVTNFQKDLFLKTLYDLGDNDDAIVLHVDMIAEGLDVPGLTALMPLRNLGKIKFLQNLGRTTRRHPEDARNIEEGLLKPADLNCIKPNCHVILPYCMEYKDDFLERNINIIEALRSEYDFDPSETIIVDILNPGQDGPEFDEDKLERQIRGFATKAITEFYHDLEEKGMKVEEILFKNRLRDCLNRGDLNVIDRIVRLSRESV